MPQGRDERVAAGTLKKTAVGILLKLLISAKGTIGENMYYFWSGLLRAIALLWSVLGLRMLRGMAGVPRLADVMPLPDGECPKVSTLFAARDEAAKLPQALPTQLAQDYPRYEVIAVDDRSRDATPQVLDEFAAHHNNLKVIHLTEVPKGWLGKPHALHVAYGYAKGEWLVFTDADVRMGPDLLRRAVALVKGKGWDYLTCLPMPELRSFWEKTFMSYWALGFDLGQAPWKLSDPCSRRYLGVGAFQLLRRSVYEAIGTHQRLAMELLDDFKLGKLVKQRGFQCGVALGGEWVQLRWQDGLSGIVSGLMKNSFAACGFRLRNVALYLLGAFAFDVLPFLALLFAVGTPREVAALCVFIVLVLHANGSHAGRVSPVYALTHPLGAAIFCYIMLRSAIVTLWRRGVVWRDTFYPLDELRKGVV